MHDQGLSMVHVHRRLRRLEGLFQEITRNVFISPPLKDIRIIDMKMMRVINQGQSESSLPSAQYPGSTSFPQPTRTPAVRAG